MIFDVIKLVLPVLDKVIPDGSKRAQAQEEIHRALIENQAQLLDAAKTVMAADAQSGNKLTSSARPIVVYWSLALITVIVGAAPFGAAKPILDALRDVPSELWTLLTAGIGIFMFGRSAEKAAANLKGGK
jgi:hypothetical protein